MGSTSDITLGGNIIDMGGSLSLSAGRNIAQNANIGVNSGNTLDVRAAGSISMQDGSVSSSASGNIRYQAGSTLSVGAITTGGNVSLKASSITDSGSAEIDVTANQFLINTTGTAVGDGAGQSSNPLETLVSTLAGNIAGGAGLYMIEANALQIDTLSAISVNQVGANAVLTLITDAAQAGLQSSGNLVLASMAGSVTTLAGGALSAAGNMLVQAGGAGSDLTLGATVTNTQGNTSLNAAQAIVQNANINATGLGKTVELIAGSAITMGANAVTAASNANILLNAAAGNVTLQTLNAGSGDVAITAQVGSIVDGNATLTPDISANGLILNASFGIASAANPLETAVGTLSAKAAGGGIYLTEANAVVIDTVSVAVQRVNLQGASSLNPVPAQTQSDLTTTGGNGNIVLIAKGTITLNDGLTADGVSVSANGSGSISINAQGAGSNVVVGTGAKVQSATGDVSITAAGTITPGVVQTQGNVSTTSGAAVFSTDINGKGQAIVVVADQVDIRATLTSVGANLSFAPFTALIPAPIVIGGIDNPAALQLSLNELALIQPGFAQISFGNGQANQSITVLGQNSAGVASPAIFKDPLVLNLTGTNSTLAVSGQLQGQSLQLTGSVANSVSTLSGADISMAGNVTLVGVLNIASGQSTITAGNNGADGVTGSLVISGNITGSLASGELLSLVSESDVLVSGSITGIDGLAVRAAGNVTFADTLTVTGNVVIDAAGAVNFAKSLSISNGGTLTIRGASSVVFGAGVLTAVDGNITIDVKSLVLLGGADSLSSNGGVLTVTSANSGNAITVGADLSAPAVAGALNFTSREIQAIGSGFSRLVLGQTNTGSITLAANADLTSVGASTAIKLRAASLTAVAGGTVRMPGAITLSVSDSLVLNSSMTTAVAASITLSSSSGNIAMAAGTSLSSNGGDVSVKVSDGHSVALSIIDTRMAGAATGSGIVDLQSGTGSISDANNDSAVNVFAKAVNFYGYGADSAAAGNVIEVQADVVRVSAPQGTVLRHADLSGYSHFDVVSGGKLYEQLVVLNNTVTRVTEDPSTLLLKDDASLVAAGLPSTSSLLKSPRSASLLPQTQLLGYITPVDQSGNMNVISYLGAPATGKLGEGGYLVGSSTSSSDVLLSDASYGIADKLQHSYMLGTPGEQPLISGLSTFSLGNYDYSVDTLSL